MSCPADRPAGMTSVTRRTLLRAGLAGGVVVAWKPSGRDARLIRGPVVTPDTDLTGKSHRQGPAAWSAPGRDRALSRTGGEPGPGAPVQPAADRVAAYRHGGPPGHPVRVDRRRGGAGLGYRP